MDSLSPKGTVMATCMALSYTNIFVDNLEKEILTSMEKTPSTWWRYIDDVFAIWPHDEEQLKVFFKYLNEFHPSIKFTAEWSSNSVTFLILKFW